MKRFKNVGNNFSKKNLYASILFFIIIIIFIICFAFYVGNENFRNFFDVKIFRKSIDNSNTATIEFDDETSTNVFAYDKYIATLNKNNFTAYNSSGNKLFNLNVNLSDPIYSTSNRFICLAEKQGNKLYLIDGQNILWQKDIEGNISKVCVNKNGYVSVIVSGTSYKSVIIFFDHSGTELFKSFLSNTLATDISISNDNKYLALSEIDFTGTSIQSNIKILSVEKSQKDPTNAFEYIYPASSNSIINSIKYCSKNKLICLYNDSIHIINDKSDSEILKISEKNDLFIDINLNDEFVRISENLDDFFNFIAINFGSQIDFINTSGWLLKTYSTLQEAKDIKIASGIAGIVYKNKVEIINL